MILTDLERDDEIEIETRPFDGLTLRVSDTEIEDLGVTEVVVVTLVAGCDRYVIKAATHSDEATITNLESNEGWHFEIEDVDIKT
jgi:hypothetical protein